jgi:hypothetical protein
MDDVLGAVTEDELTSVVCELIGDVRARLRAWTSERVAWAAENPGTLGICRVRGTADVGTEQRPFSLVVKAVVDADVPGLPATGYMHEPQDWNYWKREPLAFGSGLLDDYHGPIVPVRCVGVLDRGDLAVMWLEELHDPRGSEPWSLQQHLLAARHIARFNGDHVHNLPSTTTYPWLCRRFTHGWLATLSEAGVAMVCESEHAWQHPALRGAFPRSLGPRVADLLADARQLLAIGDPLPVALTHHDAHRDNFFRQSEGADKTRLLDWGFLGLAPVGEDLGHQVGINLFHQYIGVDDAGQYERVATDAYLTGLREAQVDPDPKRVQTYARAVAALQMVAFAAGHVAWLEQDDDGDRETPEADRSWPAAWAAERGIDTDQLMRNWAAMFGWLLDLGDQARRDAESL